jgi:Leucine-rich repeat (LRR) protein
MKVKKRKFKTTILLLPIIFVITIIATFSIRYFIKNNVVKSDIVESDVVEKVHFLKNWTIYYTSPLEADKIKDKDISVINEKGDKVNCELTLSAFGKSIEIFPPPNGYEEGKTYTLRVGNGESCTIEKIFGKRKSIKFQVIKEAADNTEIVFFDKNFESLIREEIKKPSGEIELKDVKGITSMVLTSKSILNLKGIEYFINLHNLSLDVNRIKSIESLKVLTDLNDLGLSNNQITDISSLKDCKYLKRMFLLGNPIKDYKVLDTINKNLEAKDYN